MTVPIQVWVEALEQSALEVAALALGFERCDIVGNDDTTPADVAGAFLPLFCGSGESLYIGWLGTAAARGALARGLLSYSPGEPLGEDDVADAMGEVVNILAGGIKRRMLPVVHPLALGLPMFSTGPMKPLHSKTYARTVRCGEVDSHLVLVTGGRVNPADETGIR